MDIDPNLNITELDVQAIRACMAGVASDEQQKRAINWIAFGAGLLAEPEFQPGIDRDTALHRSGRRYVGLLISIMKEPEILAHARKKKPTRGKAE